MYPRVYQAGFLATSCITAWFFRDTFERKKTETKVGADQVNNNNNPHNVFTAKDVSQHDNEKNGVWVTKGDQVYDITFFLDSHPGGKERIMLAAGKSIDPFWNIFSIHHSPHVLDILRDFHIGRLRGTQDAEELISSSHASTATLFQHEPIRLLSNFIIRTRYPFNAESKKHLLDGRFITPNVAFYVRNHLPVPAEHDEKEKPYTIKVNMDSSSHEITLDELRKMGEKMGKKMGEKMGKRIITATLQCAGNRRGDMAPPNTQGLHWDVGAIGTARWGGVSAKNVFLHFDRDFEKTANFLKGKHVEMCGNDGYCASVPLEKFMDDDTILAYEMSGEPLPLDHGAPIRAVIPGNVAARSVKWLKEISILDGESDSYWQQRDYKVFPSHIDGKERLPSEDDFKATPSIQETPVQSAILNVGIDGERRENSVIVSGYAYSGGGNSITRVDVSDDGGNTWKQAKLWCDGPCGTRENKWAWTLWNVEFPGKNENGKNGKGNKHYICRAVDSSYNGQPETDAAIWNYRGLLHNAWHHV